VLDALDVQDVALVGFSMGGGEIARYMSRHGGARVTRAALVSSVTPYMLKTADNPDGVDPAVFDGMIAGLKKDRPNFMVTFAKTFFGVGMLSSPVSSDLIEWTDFRADMAAFRVPTLVIHGDADRNVPIDVSGKATAAAIPGAEFVVYDGAPHAVPFTHAERLNADLITFLKG
jgi:non-heme chloroperoxidase